MSSSGGMMDTEPGGESTQYESIDTVNKPNSSQANATSGQLGNVSRDDVKDPVQAGLKQQAAERGEKTAENIRYGQAISESGMGGMTGTAEGVGTKDTAYGSAPDVESQGLKGGGEAAGQGERTSQGYDDGGEGAGIGG